VENNIDEDEERRRFSDVDPKARYFSIRAPPETLPAPTSNIPYQRDAEHGLPADLSERISSAFSGPGARVALVGRAGVGYEYFRISNKTLNVLMQL
jgi:hypothetical protein